MNHLKNNNRTISFIIPAMNEENTLKTLCEGISENVKGLCHSWEIIFIDDGSSDNSWSEMQNLVRHENGHVKAYRFPANRGKADALALGYAEARGDIVFTMDADLQDDPREIPRFLEKIDESHDIVTGWKQKRYDPWHKVLPSRVFNAMLSNLTGVKLHDHNCGFKAYKKAVVKSLPMYGDMHRMVPSLASFKGFQTAEIVVQHHARQFGESKYGWGRMIIGFMDMATIGFLQRFRNCPMHFAGKVAAALILTSMVLTLAGVISAFTGNASAVYLIIAAASFLTGILIAMQGLLFEQLVYRSMKNGRQLRVAEIANADEPLPSFESIHSFTENHVA